MNDAGKNYLYQIDTVLNKPGWFFIESSDKELIERFKEDFEDIIVQDIDAESVKLPGATVNHQGTVRWFAQTPYKIMDDLVSRSNV